MSEKVQILGGKNKIIWKDEIMQTEAFAVVDQKYKRRNVGSQLSKERI